MKPGTALQSAESAFMSSLRRPGHPARVTVATLNLNATYLTPTGRLCKLLPQAKHGPGAAGDSFAFHYLDLSGRQRSVEPSERDGFRLAAANIGLLREVMREVAL